MKRQPSRNAGLWATRVGAGEAKQTALGLALRLPPCDPPPMELDRYLRPFDHHLSAVQVDALGGTYIGAGFLSWDPARGVHLKAHVERQGAPLAEYSPPPVRVVQRAEWLRITGTTSFGDRFLMDVPVLDELAIHMGRLDVVCASVSFERTTSLRQQASGHHAFGLIDFGDASSVPLMPDKVRHTIVVGDRTVANGEGWHGVREKRDDGYEVTGRLDDDKNFFWLSVRLPEGRWTRQQAWAWIDSANESLAWLTGRAARTVYLEQTDTDGTLRRLYRRRDRVDDLRPYLPLLGSDRLDRTQFLALLDFLAVDGHTRRLTREMFLQLVDAKNQKSTVGRDLLFSSLLEALLRNVQKKPFAAKKADTFDLDNALANFVGEQLGPEYREMRKAVERAFRRLRDRAAHPDWFMLDEKGDGDIAAQGLDDRVLLAQFYAYVVLAFAGVKDPAPRMPAPHQTWNSGIVLGIQPDTSDDDNDP